MSIIKFFSKTKKQNKNQKPLFYYDHIREFEDIKQGDIAYFLCKNKTDIVKDLLKNVGSVIFYRRYSKDICDYGIGKDFICFDSYFYFVYDDVVVKLKKFNSFNEHITKNIEIIYTNQEMIKQCDFTIKTILNHLNYIQENDEQNMEQEIEQQGKLLKKIADKVIKEKTIAEQNVEGEKKRIINEYKEKYQKTYDSLNEFWDKVLGDD